MSREDRKCLTRQRRRIRGARVAAGVGVAVGAMLSAAFLPIAAAGADVGDAGLVGPTGLSQDFFAFLAGVTQDIDTAEAVVVRDAAGASENFNFGGINTGSFNVGVGNVEALAVQDVDAAEAAAANDFRPLGDLIQPEIDLNVLRLIQLPGGQLIDLLLDPLGVIPT